MALASRLTELPILHLIRLKDKLVVVVWRRGEMQHIGLCTLISTTYEIH